MPGTASRVASPVLQMRKLRHGGAEALSDFQEVHEFALSGELARGGSGSGKNLDARVGLLGLKPQLRHY